MNLLIENAKGLGFLPLLFHECRQKTWDSLVRSEDFIIPAQRIARPDVGLCGFPRLLSPCGGDAGGPGWKSHTHIIRSVSQLRHWAWGLNHLHSEWKQACPLSCREMLSHPSRLIAPYTAWQTTQVKVTRPCILGIPNAGVQGPLGPMASPTEYWQGNCFFFVCHFFSWHLHPFGHPGLKIPWYWW